MSSAMGRHQTISEFVSELRRMPSDGLMYASDPQRRGLLEVLWIKLALLRELLQAGPNLAGATVVAGGASHLPRLWSFHVERGSGSDGMPGAGSLWFAVLFAPDFDSVRSLDDTLSQTAAGQADLAAQVRALSNLPAFQPPAIVDVTSTAGWRLPEAALWSEVLGAGLRLRAAPEAELPHTVAHVLRDLDEQIVRVRRALFIDPPGLREEIVTVLDDLIRDPQWLETHMAPVVPSPPPTPSPAAATPVRRVEPVAQPEPEPETEDLEATVIVKRGAAAPAATAGRPAPAAPSPPKPAAPPPEDLEQTVIVSRRGAPPAAAAPPHAAPAPSPSPSAPAADEESIEATIIVPRDRKR